MAATYDLQVEQGTTFITNPFRWLYDDTDIPVDLTGFTTISQIKDSATSITSLATINVVIINALEGRFYLTFQVDIATDGRAYQDKTQLAYDVKFTSPSGVIFRVLQGYCYVSPAVSN